MGRYPSHPALFEGPRGELQIFTEPYLDSLGPFGDVIVSVLATTAAQDLVKLSENIKAALAKKNAADAKLGTLGKSRE